MAAGSRIKRRSVLTGLINLIAAPAIVRAATPLSSSETAVPLSVDSGSQDAPAGVAQYPTYFTSLNGISPYPVRPPWPVAGVDYRVGVNAGVWLKDPATIKPNVASRSGANPIVLRLEADNVVLDGYDFTMGGWWQIRSNGHANLTISNSRLQNLCIDVETGPLTVRYCEIDGLGSEGETVFGCLAFLRAGVTSSWKYNWLHSAQNDFIDLATSDIDARFNLFDTMGYEAGAHADAIQFAGDGTANNIKIMFNTYVHMVATKASPSSFIDVETQLGTGTQVMNGPEVAYNTASNTAIGGLRGSTFFRVSQVKGTIVDAYVHDNFADLTNMIGVISTTPSPGRGYRKSGNTLLRSGQRF